MCACVDEGVGVCADDCMRVNLVQIQTISNLLKGKIT